MAGSRAAAAARRDLLDLPPELLVEIHRRLDFVDRLNLAMACRGAGGSSLWQRHKTPETPCLVLPGATTETTTLFSLSDGRAATSRASDPAMRGHVVLGSTDGWIVTVDRRATLRMANPVTGEQAELPPITAGTIPLFVKCRTFLIDMNRFRQLTGVHGDRSSLQPPPFITLTDWQMHKWFYRKVILSPSPRPGSYAAMLILDKSFHGAAAFATAGEQSWRLAAGSGGVEDAIHHEGRFYSVTYSGDVVAWDRHIRTGEFTSVAVGPRIPGEHLHMRHRKYIVAAPDGRLMAVIKDLKEVKDEYGCSSRSKHAFVFDVLVLDVARRRWVVTKDIGDMALFVGVNTSLCVSTREHPGVKAGCVYYTQDELGKASQRLDWEGERGYATSSDDGYELQDVGVYALKDGTVKSVDGLRRHRSWPLPAWFTPCM